MALYRLVTNSSMIQREADGAYIPIDVLNADYVAYLAWLALGNTPDPAIVLTATTIDKAVYMARFTTAEWNGILNYAQTNTLGAGVATNQFLWTISFGRNVSLTASATTAIHAAWVAASLLTSARSATILTP